MKSLALSLSKISPEFLIDQKRFLPDLSYTFSQYLITCFLTAVSQIYHSRLQLNKANTSDTEAAFLDLHLSISNKIVSTKIYDKRDEFDFEIVNFPFLDGDVRVFVVEVRKIVTKFMISIALF